MNEDYPYQTEEVVLVQYLDGVTCTQFPDDFLVQLYRQSVADGVMEMLFPGDGVRTLAQFVTHLSEKSLLVGIVRKPYNVAESHRLGAVAGFGWLEQRQGEVGARKATMAFSMFRAYWGEPQIRAISRLALKFWFTEAEVDVLFGVMLKRNRVAQRFAITEMGFTKVADVPMFLNCVGRLEDATLVMMRKDEFLK